MTMFPEFCFYYKKKGNEVSHAALYEQMRGPTYNLIIYAKQHKRKHHMFIRRFECFTYMNYIYVKFNMDIATQMTSQGGIKIQHLIKK